MRKLPIWLVLSVGAVCVRAQEVPEPVPTRLERVIDSLHGVKVSDPYRWLERGQSKEVRVWTARQNERTRQVLDAAPHRARIERRLKELLSIGWVGEPVLRPGGRVFYLRRSGQDNQPVLYLRVGGPGRPRRILDLNRSDPGGTFQLDWWNPNRDGTLVAYGTSARGSERSTLRIRDVETGKDRPDVIPRTRAASLAWSSDGKGFFYTRYPAAGTVPGGEEDFHRHVYYHRLGDDPARDVHLFGRGREMTDWPVLRFSGDGKRLLLIVEKGGRRSEVFTYQAVAAGSSGKERGRFQPVLTRLPAHFHGTFSGSNLLLVTDFVAPRSRLVRVDPEKPAPGRWKEVVPQSDAVLKDFVLLRDRLVLLYEKDAHHFLAIHDRSGRFRQRVEFDVPGTISHLVADEAGDEALFVYTSFFVPPTIYRLEGSTGKRAVLFRNQRNDVPTETYTARQVFYPSKDGTRIPMFLLHRKGLALDGWNPTLLSGYGGFGVSLTPSFSRNRIFWLEQGGIVALANLRGGGEYGAAWQDAARLSRKQVAFDDLLAAANWLVRRNYTRPQKLALQGSSNGGLLVGGAITQKPSLFRAAICDVPLLDMIRYPLSGMGRFWIPEYGDPARKPDFLALHAYSPYHRVRYGVHYPAVLLRASGSDTRVDPCHARKMAAILQARTGSKRPILLQIDPEAGHRTGQPHARVMRELADQWTFLVDQLGVSVR